VRAIRDDEQTVESVYREQGTRLWRAVFAYTGNREVADDAVAEAFTQLLHRGDEIREAEKWVWKVAFRIAAGQLKERGHERPQQEGSYQMPEPVLDVMRALARLTPRQRQVIVLHHYADYSVKDVARIVGTSGGAVRVHLSVGRKRLRELLEDRDG
jgi:RNA polymerase sigma-70 factor (ECF subfamily)